MLKNNALKNICLLVGDKLLQLVSGLVISILVARYLGPSKLGKINYVMSFIIIFQVVVNFGIDEIILKDIVKNRIGVNIILGTAIFFRIVVGIFMYIFGYILFVYLLKANDYNKIYLLQGTMLFLPSIRTINFYFQGNSLNKQQVKISQIVFWSTGVLKSVFIIYSVTFGQYIYIYIFSTILEIVVTLFYWPLEYMKLKFKKMYLKKLIKESWPLFIQSMAIYIYMKVDQIMIGQMMGIQEVGIYSVGVSIAEIIYFVPLIINVVFYPKVSKMYNTNFTLFKSQVILISKIAIIISVVFSIFCFGLGKKFFEYFYGEEYILANKVLIVYSWASVFVGLGVCQNIYIILNRKQLLSLKANIYAAIINIVLNYILIKKIGLIGAAISTLISQIFVNFIFYLIFIKKEKEIFKMRWESFKIKKADLKDIIKLFKE